MPSPEIRKGMPSPELARDDRFSTLSARMTHRRELIVEVGARTRALAPATPRARKNEVRYSYGELRAWYRNGPLGLEQGFTLARAPLPAREGSR